MAVGALLLLAACSGTGRPGAAEPATAPPPSVTPAGTLTSVGAQPEGITFDPATGLVAVAVRDPDRLVLLDGATMAVRRTVPLPGSVRHLQLAAPGGPVLVPLESADLIGEVSLPGGALRTTPVGQQPHDAAEAAGGVLVVGNEFGHSVSFVRDGRVLATLHDVRQPGGVVADGGTAAVIDVNRFTLGTYDVATMTRTALVGAGAGPTHGVLAGGRLVVTDTRGNAVLVFTVSPLRQVARLPLAGTPYGIATDGTTVWVTLTARNQLVGLDVSGAVPRVVARYPTVRQPNTVAVAPGGRTLWLTGTATGQVERITR